MPTKCDGPVIRVLCGAALIVVCLCATVRSQEGRPQVAFEHDGKGVTGFALYAQPENGKEIRIDLGLLPIGVGGERSVTLPALPGGKYTLSIAAYNPAGESARVEASPKRITVTNADAPAQRPSPEVVSPPPPASVAAPVETGSKPGALGRFWRVVIGD